MKGMDKIIKVFFMMSGYFFLGLGIVGIFVPLLPTTPFLLLSAACFFRGSDKLYYWISHHKIFGKYVTNYHKHKAIPKRAKIFSITLLWITIISSATFFIPLFWVKIMIFIVAIVVTIHIVSLRTLTREMLDEQE